MSNTSARTCTQPGCHPKPSIVLIDASRRYLFEFTAHQIVRDMVADLRAQGLEIWVVLPARRGRRGNQALQARFRVGRGATVSDRFRCN
jgi:hypothetical protein